MVTVMNETCKKHIDSCRFCWMCRHICPIGNATGLERNNARARALGLSLVNRGVYDLSEVIDNVYECACCGACTKECVTGWDPVMFIKGARRDAALEGKLPDYIMRLVENVLRSGNAYGVTERPKTLRAATNAHAKKCDVLFFLGVDAVAKAPEEAVKAIRVMEKTGIGFTVSAGERPSGQQLDFLIGAAEETKQQMLAAAEQLNEYKTVVCYDPQDALLFKRTCGEYGVRITAKVETYTAFLARNLASLSPVKTEKAVVFQDPFQLARDLDEVEEARKIIGAYRTVREMLCNRKDTMWAGNILMAEWMPDVMKQVAADRIANARSVKADTLVTASVSEYESLRAVEQDDVKILSLEEMILGE